MMSDSFGYGQMNPADYSCDFNVISFIVRQIVNRLDTMKLVQVVAVTPGAGDPPLAGTVDVLPLVNQIDGQGNATTHGTVHGIPWSRVQGGANAVICDPQVDDIGYVVCSDRDVSSVKANKARSNPGSRRRYDVADGVYAGGCLNVAPNQYLIFTSDGVRLVDKNGNSVVMTQSGGLVLTCSNGNVLDLGQGKWTGNLEVTGTLKVDAAIHATGAVIAGFGGGDQVGLQTHTHAQPNDSHGDVEAPTAAPTAGT